MEREPRRLERLKRTPLNPEPTMYTPGDNGNEAPGEMVPLRQERNSYVRRWAPIARELPEDFNPHHLKFVRDYFRAQLRIARGQKKKARRILAGLESRAGYKEFEDGNKPLLAAIDYAVRGTSHWQDELRRKIEPAFRIKPG